MGIFDVLLVLLLAEVQEQLVYLNSHNHFYDLKITFNIQD